jgi:hypothetical protein
MRAKCNGNPSFEYIVPLVWAICDMRNPAGPPWNKKVGVTVYIGRANQNSRVSKKQTFRDLGFESQGEITMKEKRNSKVSNSVYLAVVAIVAIGVTAAPSIHAKPKSEEMAGKHANKIILVRPTDLPEQARQTGEAMLLHETGDGRTLLYIEQNRGARLVIFDVTDPSNIKAETSVEIGAPSPFDFVFPIGDHAELIRFRQGQGMAVLDLRKVKVPTMKIVQGLELQALKERVGDDGFIVVNQADAPPARDYQVVETANSQELNRVFGVKGVREETTNDHTGTTFLLTTDGLYVIRRPAVEEDYSNHEDQLNFPG